MSDYFAKNCEGKELEYPLTELPPEELELHSPIVNGQAFGVPTPPLPGSEEYEEAWGTVAKVVADVKAGVWPDWFLYEQGLDGGNVPGPLKKHVERREHRFNPILSAEVEEPEVTKDPMLAAQLVRMDQPCDLIREMLLWFGANDPIKLKSEYVLTTHVDFLGYVRTYALIQVAVSYAMNRAFSAKWYYGAKRPEERFEWGARFTTYEEGCPPHPAYVAGHGALAGAVRQMFHVLFDLTPEQAKIVDETTGQFAHFRSFAGMHFPADNEQGLELGAVKADEWCVEWLVTMLEMLALPK